MKEKYGLPLVLIVVFALTRLPGLMPWNFSAAYALAFCAGVYFPGRLAWWLPLGTLLATDVLLNVFYYHEPVFTVYMAIKTLSFLGIIALGRLFSPRTNWFKLVGGGLLAAVLFYVVTNTASWINDPAYAKTLAGWIQALTVGRPDFHPTTLEFFRNTLLSGGLFTALFAGAMKIAAAAESAKEKEPEPAEEPEGEQPDEAKA
ncbi:MAG: hypothetical protein HY298_00865 [Verrucomicrobia bacterium]|nr:hypothetical protein [Verrucomicrobiota bacterium]